MKKIFLTILCLLSLFSFNQVVDAKAISIVTSMRSYVRRDFGSSFISSVVRKCVKYGTDELLLSVEPFKKYENGDVNFEYSDDLDDIDLKVKRLAYIIDILTNESEDNKYVNAGQKMIWEEIGGSEFVYFSNGGFRDDTMLADYISDINAEYDRRYSTKLFDLGVNDYLEFNSKYEVDEISGESIEIKDGKIYGTKPGITHIKFKYKTDEKLYDMEKLINPITTDYISAGNFIDYVDYEVNVIGGTISLNITNLNRDNKYELYDFNNELIYTFELNEDGIYNSDYLLLGDYVLKDTDSGLSYNISIKNDEISSLDISYDEEIFGIGEVEIPVVTPSRSEIDIEDETPEVSDLPIIIEIPEINEEVETPIIEEEIEEIETPIIEDVIEEIDNDLSDDVSVVVPDTKSNFNLLFLGLIIYYVNKKIIC